MSSILTIPTLTVPKGNMDNFMERVDEFVRAADRISAEYWTRMNYIHSSPPTHRADYISDKWVRVVTLEERNGIPQVSSVYAFIVQVDGFTKTLGVLKKGDIHKPASFKAPAKHARGNIFQADFANCLNSVGVNYMK